MRESKRSSLSSPYVVYATPSVFHHLPQVYLLVYADLYLEMVYYLGNFKILMMMMMMMIMPHCNNNAAWNDVHLQTFLFENHIRTYRVV